MGDEGKGEQGAKECDRAEVDIPQSGKCLNSPWGSELAQERSLDLVPWSSSARAVFGSVRAYKALAVLRHKHWVFLSPLS